MCQREFRYGMSLGLGDAAHLFYPRYLLYGPR
jgi:hypothetical protein